MPPPRVLAVPATFDVDAVAMLERELVATPLSEPVVLDFSAVTVCRALAFSVLLYEVTIMGRPTPVRLANLNSRQRLLLNGLRIDGVLAIEQSSA